LRLYLKACVGLLVSVQKSHIHSDEADTLTLRVLVMQQRTLTVCSYSLRLLDRVKSRKRPKMLSVWFCTKAV